MHGGLSTGPKTEEGREQIAQAKWRAGRYLGNPAREEFLRMWTESERRWLQTVWDNQEFKVLVKEHVNLVSALSDEPLGQHGRRHPTTNCHQTCHHPGIFRLRTGWDSYNCLNILMGPVGLEPTTKGL